MFEPSSIAGMLVGLAVIVGATYLLVRGHRSRERHEAESSGVPEAAQLRDGDTRAGEGAPRA